MKIDYKYLDKLLLDVNNKKRQFKYFKINEINAEITYLRCPSSLSFDIFKTGLMGEFCKQKYKIKEQAKLRSGSKNFLKIYNMNEQIIKIDSFISGEIDVVFLANYVENKRYLFPFFPDGSKYLTYVYVARYIDEVVSEEYLVDSDQIVYEKYEKINKNETNYLKINYVPNGKFKILDYERGIFNNNVTITYDQIEQKTWLDELRQ